MSIILAAATGFPPHYYSQEEMTALVSDILGGGQADTERLAAFHYNAAVKGRYLALPAESYRELDGFGAHNDAYIDIATGLGEATVRSVLEQAGVTPEEVKHFTFTTVTGLAVPSIDGRLMNRIPFPPALKRIPIFGLGCLGGAAALARAADYLCGYPQDIAIVLSVELCSLTLQRQDLSTANLVSSGLFGDGAAAVLLAGRENPHAAGRGPRVVDCRSIFFPDTERILGWDIVDTGFKMVLSTALPQVARTGLRPGLEAFLAEHGLDIGDIAHWIVHPGGPKVIDAVEAGLALHAGALQLSRDSLARVGNVSSASVLIMLCEVLAGARPAAGAYGLLLGMGPSFGAEAILLQW